MNEKNNKKATINLLKVRKVKSCEHLFSENDVEIYLTTHAIILLPFFNVENIIYIFCQKIYDR